VAGDCGGQPVPVDGGPRGHRGERLEVGPAAIGQLVQHCGWYLPQDSTVHQAGSDHPVQRHAQHFWCLGAVTVQGRNNAETFQYVRPGFDLLAERAGREQTGAGEQIDDGDLYPDTRPALAELRARGLWVGVAGNQTARAGQLLRDLDLPADAVATSGEWGVAKPDPEFYDRVAAFARGNRSEIVQLGDHRDYDIAAASSAGLRTALIRRGPWGYLWAADPIVTTTADWVVNSLAELPDLLRPLS
jgi:N-acetyl-D-muramate 6-phosphate phosphatase